MRVWGRKTSDESVHENVMKRRRREPSPTDEIELSSMWRHALKFYECADETQHGTYPRWQRLFDIVQADGRIRLLLNYDEQNPNPDLRNYGERRQVESLLAFERPLEQLMAEAESRWRAGNFAGEATLLEEFADSNPQKEAILDLAAEARRDAVSGASTRVKPKRR